MSPCLSGSVFLLSLGDRGSSLVQFFHPLDRRPHQLFQDLLIHILQPLDIQTPHAGRELAELPEQVCMRLEAVIEIECEGS